MHHYQHRSFGLFQWLLPFRKKQAELVFRSPSKDTIGKSKKDGKQLQLFVEIEIMTPSHCLSSHLISTANYVYLIIYHLTKVNNGRILWISLFKFNGESVV